MSKAEARHKAVIRTDRDEVVTAIDDKPTSAATGRIATEVFVYDAARLLEELESLRRDLSSTDPGLSEGLGDFGEHLLPRIVAQGKTIAFPLRGYWKDLGRPASYLRAHRDLLEARVDVFDDPAWPMLTRFPEAPPARFTGNARLVDSMVSPGCVIAGTVRRSVLGPGVHVEAGAVVEDCVLFERVVVAERARVRTSLVDAGVVIASGARVGSTPRHARVADEDITLIGADSVVGEGVVLGRGARLEPGTSA